MTQEKRLRPKVTIKIPQNMYDTLSRMIEDTGFSSVNEFVVFAMRTIILSDSSDLEDSLTTRKIKTISKKFKQL